jgi:hypothetical protein
MYLSILQFSPPILFRVSLYVILCLLLRSSMACPIFHVSFYGLQSFLLPCSSVFPLLLCYLWSSPINSYVLLYALPVHIHFSMCPVSCLLTYSVCPLSSFLLYLFALFHVSSCTILYLITFPMPPLMSFCVFLYSLHLSTVMAYLHVNFSGFNSISGPLEGWVAKSVARQLATAVLWVRIQTSLKNHKWAT